MKKLLVILLLVSSFIHAETEFAVPKPSIDNPRKILFSITTGDKNEINHILGSINNVMKFYGPENTEITVVAYSQGVHVLQQKWDTDIRKRVEALMTYDVVFIACGNTMRTLKIEEKDLLDDVETVTAGIVEIIEKQLEGYIYIQA